MYVGLLAALMCVRQARGVSMASRGSLKVHQAMPTGDNSAFCDHVRAYPCHGGLSFLRECATSFGIHSEKYTGQYVSRAHSSSNSEASQQGASRI